MSANFSNAFNGLIGNLLNLYLAALILRILLQWLRAEFYNPFSQFVWRVTNLPVQPLARIIPRWRRLDVAACIVLLAFAVLSIYIGAWLWNQPMTPVRALAWAPQRILYVLCNTYVMTMLVQCLLSLFGATTSGSGASALWIINEPLLRPLRRVVRPMAGLDVSPMIVTFVLYFISTLLRPPFQ